ncbi:MAG: pentapeptide repeat-containing protein [Spirochaetia bacterium]|nr:pentapeptide repeat-containing protein [Spirochaetia bacterium]
MNYELPEYNGIEIANEDFTKQDLSGKVFYNCDFRGCNFTQAILSSSDFESCSFIDCNFTNPIIVQTKFIDVKYEKCKLMGLNFYLCSQFAFDVTFDECLISNCNFGQMKMKSSKFTKCEIIESYFQDTFLEGATFEGSNFKGTLFHNTNLEKASFCNASGYNIDPTVNRIRKAKFTVPDVLNLLNTFNIEIKS